MLSLGNQPLQCGLPLLQRSPGCADRRCLFLQHLPARSRIKRHTVIQRKLPAAGFVLRHTGFELLPLQPGPFLQLCLDPVIEPCPEQVPEDFLPALGVRREQIPEGTLGNEHRLGELRRIQPQQVADPRCGFPVFQHPGLRLELQALRVRGFLELLFILLELRLHGLPCHDIDLSLFLERQGHPGDGPRFSVFAPQHLCIPLSLRGLAIEGIHKAIKEHGFPRPGFSRDQDQALSAEGRKVDDLPVRIGTKGLQFQFQRFHTASISSSNSASNASWRWFRSCPFCDR